SSSPNKQAAGREPFVAVRSGAEAMLPTLADKPPVPPSLCRSNVTGRLAPFRWCAKQIAQQASGRARALRSPCEGGADAMLPTLADKPDKPPVPPRLCRSNVTGRLAPFRWCATGARSCPSPPSSGEGIGEG